MDHEEDEDDLNDQNNEEEEDESGDEEDSDEDDSNDESDDDFDYQTSESDDDNNDQKRIENHKRKKSDQTKDFHQISTFHRSSKDQDLRLRNLAFGTNHAAAISQEGLLLVCVAGHDVIVGRGSPLRLWATWLQWM